MRMHIADGFEHFQLAGFNDGDGLRAGDGRKAVQKIFNGFAVFEGVNQILQEDTRADKDGRAAHGFGIGMHDAFQIFHGHNMVKIPRPVKLSPANMDGMRAPAVLRRERRWVRSPLAGCRTHQTLSACRPLRLEPPRSKNWQIVTVDYFNPAATLIFK